MCYGEVIILANLLWFLRNLAHHISLQLLGQSCCLADLEGLDQALHHGLTSWLQEEDSSALEGIGIFCTMPVHCMHC